MSSRWETFSQGVALDTGDDELTTLLEAQAPDPRSKPSSKEEIDFALGYCALTRLERLLSLEPIGSATARARRLLERPFVKFFYARYGEQAATTLQGYLRRIVAADEAMACEPKSNQHSLYRAALAAKASMEASHG